jgi:superfamily II DNA/RNA helicase
MFRPQLDNLGIAELNAMQNASIEACATGKDVVLLSPTGSGKTVAFLLPILANLSDRKTGVQALVLAPSRELALQIEQVFRNMHTGFKVNCCYGGHSMRTERNNLSEAPAVLIGTPGRLADHIRRESFDPKDIDMLVLDEFDKSLELGFQKEMEAIIGQCRFLKQRLLISATAALEIPAFAGLTSPTELNFIKDHEPVGLTVKIVKASGVDKLDALLSLLCVVGEGAALVFCNHRETVERISDLLMDQGLAHDIFHGGLKQEDRERALIKFRNGSHEILITTDLAARGLDIPEIRHVVHYQIPGNEAAFTHRNGRTARMHSEGTSYLVLSEKEFVPEYLSPPPEVFKLPKTPPLPKLPIWATLYIGAGKKDKIRKVDIVGLLLQKGELEKDELGLIELQDHAAYAAVKRDKIQNVESVLRNERLKKKKVKIAISI